VPVVEWSFTVPRHAKESIGRRRGHKQACREKGQIEIGDDMQIMNPMNRLYEFVKVISSVGADHWQIKRYGESEDVVTVVGGADLVRLRPPSKPYNHCLDRMILS
jgi:hypothetical protein